jgi:hypothetical protein
MGTICHGGVTTYHDPKFEGMNPTAGGSRNKLQKETSQRVQIQVPELPGVNSRNKKVLK